MYREIFFSTLSFLVIMGIAFLAFGSNDPGNEILGVWKLKEIIIR